jgi:hypothetical protein
MSSDTSRLFLIQSVHENYYTKLHKNYKIDLLMTMIQSTHNMEWSEQGSLPIVTRLKNAGITSVL